MFQTQIKTVDPFDKDHSYRDGSELFIVQVYTCFENIGKVTFH